jgi:alkylation response protein AidB-like acyl-CoA dehydrogenase
MDLAMNDDQQMLVQSVAALFDKKSRPEHVRAAEPLGFDKALWDSVQELGLAHMAVPEDQG